eukprot:scaffold9997_cov101-Isochrysis_galbana.AAC.2
MLRWIRSVSQAVSMFGSDFQSAPFSKSERKACSNLAHGIAFSAPKWRVQKVSRLAVEWSGVQEKPIVLLLRSIGLSPRISRCVTRMGNVVLDLLLVGVFGYTNRRHDRACGLDRSDSGSARTSAASSASSKYCEMAASRLCIPKAQAVERSDGSFNESDQTGARIERDVERVERADAGGKDRLVRQVRHRHLIAAVAGARRVLGQQEDYHRRLEDRIANPAQKLAAGRQAAVIDPHGVTFPLQCRAKTAHHRDVRMRVANHDVGRGALFSAAFIAAAGQQSLGMDGLGEGFRQSAA